MFDSNQAGKLIPLSRTIFFQTIQLTMEELCVPISIQQQLFKNGAISENHAIIEAGFSAAYKYGILIVQASRFFSMQQALEEYISISLIRAVNLSLKNVIS